MSVEIVEPDAGRQPAARNLLPEQNNALALTYKLTIVA
jgi:hypothetical protein